MARRLRMEPTVPIFNPPRKVVVLIGFLDVWHYLHLEIQKYDREPHFTSAILGLLCREALGYGSWIENNDIQDAIHDLETVGFDQSVAFELCRGASHLIYEKITQHIPDWGSYTYQSTAKYVMRSEHVAQIEFDASLFR